MNSFAGSSAVEARERYWHFGTFRLDTHTRELRNGDAASLALTGKVFDTLCFLIRNRDRVVSKTEILTNVWDEFYEGDPNIVEVYIGYLRRKIDAPFGRASIQTVRGAGYRLHGDGR